MPMGPVEARAMFGGHALRLDGITFGLIFAGKVYLRVDADTRAAFHAAGCQPFGYRHKKSGKMVEMPYFEVPAGTLDSNESFLPWAEAALLAARRARQP